MQFKLTKQQKDTINKIHLLSGCSYREVRDVYEGFLYSIILSYLEERPLDLPFLGELEVSYLKDVLTQKGREADVSIDITPDAFIKRVIGQIEDKEESDVEKILRDKIHESLKDLVEEKE